MLINTPAELADTIKTAQVETGRFFQPFVSNFNEKVEFAWDGAHFILKTISGPRPFGEEFVQGFLPLRPALN